MKLIFMGTPEFAVPSLRALLDAGHTVQTVFTQPDKPVGRKQVLTAPPVKLFAQAHNLAVQQPTRIKTPEARAAYEPLFQAADAGIVAAYGRILPDWMLAAPRFGCINVHSSLLPKYRGAAPIHWAIANGEYETGVTIMQMDAGLDTGDILQMRALPIGAAETTIALTPRLAELGANLLVDTLAKLERGELTSQPQDHTQATYAPILKREDGAVNWSMSATQIVQRLRGFTPFPGCYTTLNEQRLEIIAARVAPASETLAHDLAVAAPGTLVAATRDALLVECGARTQLHITAVQPAGKKSMSARDFQNGAKLPIGTRFGTTNDPA